MAASSEIKFVQHHIRLNSASNSRRHDASATGAWDLVTPLEEQDRTLIDPLEALLNNPFGSGNTRVQQKKQKRKIHKSSDLSDTTIPRILSSASDILSSNEGG